MDQPKPIEKLGFMPGPSALTLACSTQIGAGPAVMATLHNLAISLHRLAGVTNIAAASQQLSRHPTASCRYWNTARSSRDPVGLPPTPDRPAT